MSGATDLAAALMDVARNPRADLQLTAVVLGILAVVAILVVLIVALSRRR